MISVVSCGIGQDELRMVQRFTRIKREIPHKTLYVMGIALGLVGQASVYCDRVNYQH